MYEANSSALSTTCDGRNGFTASVGDSQTFKSADRAFILYEKNRYPYFGEYPTSFSKRIMWGSLQPKNQLDPLRRSNRDHEYDREMDDNNVIERSRMQCVAYMYVVIMHYENSK